MILLNDGAVLNDGQLPQDWLIGMILLNDGQLPQDWLIGMILLIYKN